LLFFYGLGHVGIYVGHGMMIDAPHTGAVVELVPVSYEGAWYVGATRPT
jgi:cell wall-associated NlpC family hydrolase